MKPFDHQTESWNPVSNDLIIKSFDTIIWKSVIVLCENVYKTFTHKWNKPDSSHAATESAHMTTTSSTPCLLPLEPPTHRRLLAFPVCVFIVKTPLSFSDNQAETCLIITSNDTSLEYLPLIINISDTCKNQPNRLDFDNTFNLSSLWSIVIPQVGSPWSRSSTLSRHSIPGLSLLSTHKRRTIIPRTLDAKTGLLTHLFTGIQVWKWPVYRLQTCYGRQSLKLCLIDSDFLFSPPAEGRFVYKVPDVRCLGLGIERGEESCHRGDVELKWWFIIVDKARAKGKYVKWGVGVVAIGATSMLRLIVSCGLGEDVANLRFELGVESRAAETELVLVVLARCCTCQLLKLWKSGWREVSRWVCKNKMRAKLAPQAHIEGGSR